MIAYENLKHITPDMVVLESIGTTISPMTGLSYAVMQDGKHYDPDTETYIGEIDVDEYMGTISNDDEITFMALQDQEDFINYDYERYYKFAKGGNIQINPTNHRYHILGYVKFNKKPELLATTNDKSEIKSIINKLDFDKDSIFITDDKEDRVLYNFAKGGEVEYYDDGEPKLDMMEKAFLLQPLDDYGYYLKIGNTIHYYDNNQNWETSKIGYAKGGSTISSLIQVKSGNNGKMETIYQEPKNTRSLERAKMFYNQEKYDGKSVFLLVDYEVEDKHIAKGDEEMYAKGGKVYSIDIDTQDGNEIRDFQYTHNEFGLHQATEYFNKLKARGIVEYNDKGHLISNIQLLEVDEKGDYKVLDSKFFDEFAKGGKNTNK